jgi:hypothetical protein
MTGLPTTHAMLRYIHMSPTFEREKPYHFSGPLNAEDEKSRTNITFEEHDIPIMDVRTEIDKLDLDSHGFKIVSRPYLDYDGLAEPKGLEVYMYCVIGMLKEELNAENAFCYDYRVVSLYQKITRRLTKGFIQFRKSRLNAPGDTEEMGGSYNKPNEPAWQVHVGKSLSFHSAV